MAEQERNPPPPQHQEEPTMREMMFPNNNSLRPLGITLPEITDNWELRHSFMQILPKFSDMPGEDPQRHLQDFEMVCGTIRTTEEAKKEYIRLISFPFSLQDFAREWLYNLPTGSITTWAGLQEKFLERYYPVSRIQNARKRMSTIHMGSGESFYDYWCRFKTMMAKCPQHQISEQDLIQYFVNGLRPNDRQFVSAACGGSILNKQPSVAFKLLEDMAEESRDDANTMVKTTTEKQTTSSVDPEVGNMMAMMKQMMELMKPTLAKKGVKACQLCFATTHNTDECHLVTDEEEVNAFGHNNTGNGGNQNQGQKPRFDPYNPPWKNHENLRYGGTHYQAPPGKQAPPPKGPSLAEIVYNQGTEQQRLIQELEKFKVETRGTVQSILVQLAQIGQDVSKLTKQQGVLPAQVQVPPNAQINAINLRSGKNLPGREGVPNKEAVEI